MTNPVSGTLVSRATAASHSSDGVSSSKSTAAGFPVNGLSVNESTVLNRTLATRRRYLLGGSRSKASRDIPEHSRSRQSSARTGRAPYGGGSWARPVRDDLPSGTVTFLFTDVEGSTRLLHELGAEGYAEALAEHRRVLREAFARARRRRGRHAGRRVLRRLPDGAGRARGGGATHRGAGRRPDPGADRPPHRDAARHRRGVRRRRRPPRGADRRRRPRRAGARLGIHGCARRHGRAARPGRAPAEGPRPRPSGSTSSATDEFPPLKSLYRTNLPVPATPFLGRERELAEVRRAARTRTSRLLTLTGPGGTGKTRLGAAGGRRGIGALPGRRLLGAARAAARPGARAGDARRRRSAPRTASPSTSPTSRCCCSSTTSSTSSRPPPGLAELLAACPNLAAARDEPRAAPRVRASRRTRSRRSSRGRGRSSFSRGRARSIPSFVASDDGAGALRAGSTTCRSRSSSPPRASASSRPSSCSSGSRSGSTCSRAAATPTRASRRCGRRSSGRTTCSTRTSSGSSRGSPSSPAAARSRRPRRSATPTSTRSSRSSTRASSALREGGRFWMLETIREYAAERLEESGEADELRQRHAEHFLALAEEAEPHAREVDAAWLDRLERSTTTCGRRSTGSRPPGETQLVLRLAGALMDFWGAEGTSPKGAVASRTRSPPTRARPQPGPRP